MVQLENILSVAGILITGGFNRDDRTSVEIFSLQSNTSCTLKSLPSPAGNHVQHNNMICKDNKCFTRDERTGDWSQSHQLKYVRDNTCVWEVEDGVILMGGYGSDTTSVMVRYDGTVEQTFDLQYSR